MPTLHLMGSSQPIDANVMQKLNAMGIDKSRLKLANQKQKGNDLQPKSQLVNMKTVTTTKGQDVGQRKPKIKFGEKLAKSDS